MRTNMRLFLKKSWKKTEKEIAFSLLFDLILSEASYRGTLFHPTLSCKENRSEEACVSVELEKDVTSQDMRKWFMPAPSFPTKCGRALCRFHPLNSTVISRAWFDWVLKRQLAWLGVEVLITTVVLGLHLVPTCIPGIKLRSASQSAPQVS